MANTRLNGTQRRLRSGVDSCPQDRTETDKGKDVPNGESRSTAETPTLWHGGVQSECWARLAPRLRRLPRRRTSLHCSRPFEGAAARFVSPRSEFLTE